MLKAQSPVYKLCLLTATIIWGASFFVLKGTLDVLPVNYVLAIRFTTGTVLLALLFVGRMRAHAQWAYVWRGLVLGTLLFAAYWAQTIGLTQVTPGKNAFLTAGYAVLVPFFAWGLNRVRPDRYNLTAAVMLVIGVGLVSLTGGIEDLSMGFGDLMTLVSAVFYAAHIVCTARFTEVASDAIVLTVYQFAGSAIWAWLLTCTTETIPGLQVWTADVIVAMLFLAVCATTIALLLQNIGVKHVEASSAAIILSLESVFGVAFSMLFYGETLTPRLALGFAVIFAAVIISETKLSFLRKRDAVADSE